MKPTTSFLGKLSVVLAISFVTGAAFAADKDKETKPAKLKPYPMETCSVSGEKLGEMGEPFVFAYEGRELKLCCKDCKKDFDKEPTKYLSKVDAAAKKVKAYPLKTCIVSDEKLGEMGEPYAFVYKGQEFDLCCKDCKKDFDKDPIKFTKKLETSAKK